MPVVSPLPRRVDHELGEPAYSLLVRSLVHNGSRRIGPAIDRVIGGRERAPSRWDPAEVARICKADPDSVRRATPVVGTKTAEVMGQTLLAEHVGSRTRRWCPACMREQAYHRVWWDILPVTSCPEHGTKLATSCVCKRRSLQWRSGSLRHCPSGHPLDAIVCTEADPDVLAFDAYVVGRLRGDVERLRGFDDVGLGELVAVCERLGKASLDEGCSVFVVRKAHGIDRLHAEGFRILRGLPEAFDDLLGRLSVGEVWLKEKCQLRRAYGSLYDFVRELPGHSVGSALQSALADHVRRNLNVRSGLRLEGNAPLVDGRIVVTEAADALGILYERLLDLMERLGIPWERRGRSFEMSVVDFEALKARLDGSLGLKKMCDALHLPPAEVAGLASAGLLDVVATGQGSAGWIFPANAADDLLDKLRARGGKPGPSPEHFVSMPLAARRLGISVAEALPLVLDGSVEVRARWSKRQGLAGFRVDLACLARIFASGNQAGVTLTVAAHRLGLTLRTMDAAVASSLLRTEAVRGEHRVTDDEVERFRAAWAPMRELRRVMGVTAWLPVATALDRAGVSSPMADCPFRERVYPREEAMRACAAATSPRDDAKSGAWHLPSLAAALNLPSPMVYQSIEAGLISTGEGSASGGVPDGEIERFKEAYATLPELSAAFGLSGPRAVLSVLDKAAVPAICRRPAFHSYLFPRGEATKALRAWSRAKEAAREADRPLDEPLLGVGEVATRLGTEPNMVAQLVSNELLASTRRGRAIMVPVSEVERFSRRYAFANEVARLAGRTRGHGVGASVTKVLLRDGVRPVCSRPKFVSYVFDRAEAIEAIGRLGLS